MCNQDNLDLKLYKQDILKLHFDFIYFWQPHSFTPPLSERRNEISKNVVKGGSKFSKNKKGNLKGGGGGGGRFFYNVWYFPN